MELGLIRSVDINDEMQQAYLDYAMSVIVARALPDARDGLKPVHRRILYAMHDMGIGPNSAYKKSARIVGEVLGKYHPHGDSAVYESMARMAQDFSMRCLLVDGQGNFGSVDGDPPAAMRYTEARLTSAATQLLADIAKNTVDFTDNFDGSLQEPVVLPASLPNLLVNGTTGIAVGMSTSIPPHNLGEVIDALNYMLAHWDKLDDINLDDLMNFIKGPDFPTGGIMLPGDGENDLKAAYGTGRGRVTIQARLHMEEMSRGRSRIIVTELPYMVNKASLIERIASLAREERIDGIADLRDESDRHGLRIVIELNKNADPDQVLQELFKTTPLRDTFSIIMLALVDGEPRMLSLKQALRVYLDHRLVVIRRRAEYELEKARARAHILEGYLVAIKNIDEVIATIRRSPDVETARTRLIRKYKLSEIQAQAILDLQLRRLAALERKKIEDEYKAVQATIKSLTALLRSPKKMRELCVEELGKIKEQYGEARKTFIASTSATGEIPAAATMQDLAPDSKVWVSVDEQGLISRTTTEKPPRISGNTAPKFLLQTNTRDVLYIVAENGEAAALPVHTLPACDTPSDGSSFWKVAPLPEGTPLAALLALPPKENRPEGWYVFTATRQGMVKKSDVNDVPGASAKPFILVKVNDGDRLGWLKLTDGSAHILLATADGMAIRFSEDDVRPMGLVAAGVNGIKLGARDELVGMDVLPERGEVFLVTQKGKAKRCTAALFPKQGRYGQGVVAWKLPRTDSLAGMAVGKPSTRITLNLTRLAPKAIRLDAAPLQTRTAQGKDILGIKSDVNVLGLMIPFGDSLPEEASPPVKKTTRRRTTKSNAEQLSLDLESKKTTTRTRRPAAKQTTSTRNSRKPTAKKTTTASKTRKTPAKKTTTTRKRKTNS